MPTEQRDPRRFRRKRDALLERLYDAAKDERRRLADQLTAEFRGAVDALEDFDAAHEGADR